MLTVRRIWWIRDVENERGPADVFVGEFNAQRMLAEFLWSYPQRVSAVVVVEEFTVLSRVWRQALCRELAGTGFPGVDGRSNV